MKYRKKLIILIIITITSFIFIFKIFPNSISTYSSYNHYEIYDKNNDLLIELQNGNEISTLAYEEIPESFIKILVFLEDKNFFNHSGFDIYRIVETIFTNIFNNQSHGASTITQQYIKNVYLSSNKNLARKIVEAILSVSLEKNATKEEILTAYCSTIYLGNNQYGIKNAAKYYFNKELFELSVNEMVLLCTILKAPSIYNPITNPTTTNQKKDELLTHLYNNNIISKKDYQESNLIYIYANSNHYLSSNLKYFIDILKQELNNLNHNFSMKETIKIYTYYNKSLDLIELNELNGDYSMLIANKEGYLEYIIGGNNYYTSSYNIAYQGKRDIGSTIKPLLYYEALKCGISENKSYISKPYTLIYKDECYTFNNYANIYPTKAINMQYALATSDNIYAIKTHLSLGMTTLVNHLKLYDINAYALPSLALGSVSMSLKQLVQIYQTLQNNGLYKEIKIIKQITTKKQTIKTTLINKKILDSKYTTKISTMMEGMFDLSIASNVTGASIAQYLPCKVSGKSGLTNYDSYMIGFNDEYIIGCWSGYIDNTPLNDSNLKSFPKKMFLEYLKALC